jgi:signal transduction histidine kinase
MESVRILKMNKWDLPFWGKLPNRVFLYLLAVALITSACFWTGQYIFFQRIGFETCLQQGIWFTGILFSLVFLAGLFCGALLRHQNKPIKKNDDIRMKQVALTHTRDFLSMNSGDPISLLNQQSHISPKSRAAGESFAVGRKTPLLPAQLDSASPLEEPKEPDQKRAEEALQIKTQELLRSNEELEQFACVASHDLQTPLRAISGYLNLLTMRYQGSLDEDAHRFIQRSIENVKWMQQFINDLLAYSRLTTRGHPFQSADCNEVLQEVLHILQPSIEESGGMVTHGPLPTILADRSQLNQLFQNLIGNAIKFRDHEPPEVHIKAQRVEKGWLFSVKDKGIGIDPRYGDRIFQVFQRLHTMDQYPGTGMGLAICKKVIERHGGRIWVESKLEEGATFKFIIPDPDGIPA